MSVLKTRLWARRAAGGEGKLTGWLKEAGESLVAEEGGGSQGGRRGRCSGEKLEDGVGEDEAELVDLPLRCGDGDGHG